MSALKIAHNEDAGRFFVEIEGHSAELIYRIDGDRILMLSTQVPPPVEGRGIGSALASAAVAYARERGLTIVPVCNFVRYWLSKHREPGA